MSQMLPPSLAAQLAPPAEPDEKDELGDLQGAIDAIHGLMVTLKDPGAVHQVATALRLLTGLQQKMMQESGGPASAPPQ